MIDYENRGLRWISLYESLFDHGWDADMIAIWVYLLMKANFSETNFGGVRVCRGQIMTGRQKIAEALNINQNKVRRILQFFESEQQIEQQATNKYTIITIKNYDRYQKVNNKMNNSHQQPPTELPNIAPSLNVHALKNKIIINNKKSGRMYMHEGFEKIWANYPSPNPDKKYESFLLYEQSVKTEEDQINIEKALENYIKYIKYKEYTGKFIKSPQNFFSCWEQWVSFTLPGSNDASKLPDADLLNRIKKMDNCPICHGAGKIFSDEENDFIRCECNELFLV